MPRGYRCIVLALVGWLALAAGPAPNNAAQPQQRPAEQQAQNALDAIAAAQNQIAESTKTGEYQQPCADGEYDNRSDLCAQWYAARAARDAADWAFWALVIGLVGAVGIVGALWLTIDSNRIARDTARRQLRAYVSVKRVDLLNFELGKTYGVKLRARNSGQSPATQIKVNLHCALTNVTPTFDPADIGNDSVGVIGPGGELFVQGNAPEPLDQLHMDAVKAGTAHIFAFGEITYNDTFGETHSSRFRLKAVFDADGKSVFHVCAEGNEAN